MKEIYLCQLNKSLRYFLTSFLICLTVGVSFGLVFLFHTTDLSIKKTSTNLIENKSNYEEDFGLDESNSKSTGELLMTTHNHIIGFSFIFLLTGGIFYFNSMIKGFWKAFFLIEPLISTIISFSSMWGVRMISENFIYLTSISAVVMYFSFYFMVIISIYDLTLKQPV